MLNTKPLLFCIIIISTISANISFAASPIFVSTDQDVAITIDVSASLDINEQSFNSISLSATTGGGSVNQLGTTAQFSYTPASGYTGADSFTYQLLDAANAILGTGSVTISVGIVDTGSVQGSPVQAIADNLNTICIQNTAAGQNLPATLVDLCADFTTATQGELSSLVNQLAPKEIGGQNQLSSTVAKQQIDNVRKRMANLRIGQAQTGLDVSSLKVNMYTPGFNSADLLHQGRGGAASSAGAQRLGTFASGKIAYGEHEESNREDGYKISSRGLSAGADYRLNSKLVIGAALGLNRSQQLVDNNGGDTDIGGFSLLAYGSYYLSSKTYIEAVAAIYLNSIESNRNLSYQVLGETRSATASSSTNNDMLSISLGIGYEILSRRGLTLNISANLDQIQSSFDGYAESGESNTNLIIDKRELTQTTYSLNTSATYVINAANGVYIPQVDFIWKHEFEDKADIVQARFRNDPNKETFRFSTETPDTDYFKLNVGVSHIVPGGNTGFIYYETVLSKRAYSENSLSIGMRIPL